jgi:hypothetical protein
VWGNYARPNSEGVSNAAGSRLRCVEIFLIRSTASYNETMASATPSASEGRQLPTRVSNACDRCRRNKSRCDPYRPCSLCTRANVQCLAGSYEQQPRSSKRKRTRGPSCDALVPPETLSATEASPQIPPRQELDEISDDRGNSVNQSQLQTFGDVQSRRQSMTESQVDSAIGIAQKVSSVSQYERGNSTHATCSRSIN